MSVESLDTAARVDAFRCAHVVRGAAPADAPFFCLRLRGKKIAPLSCVARAPARPPGRPRGAEMLARRLVQAVRATPKANSTILVIEANTVSASLSADLANAFAEKYIIPTHYF
mgnify:CR=1 FL=1